MPFMVDMAVEGQDLTLKLDLDSSLLRVLDNQNAGTVVAEQALDLTDGVVVQGSDLDDLFTIDFDVAFFLPKGIQFHAGFGADKLFIGAGQFASVIYGALGPDAGGAQLGDGTSTSTIDYSGLEAFTDLSSAERRRHRSRR